MIRDVDRTPEDRMAFERLIFFSDAVFAIAITLLALELRPPEMPLDQVPTQMVSRLVELTPKFFSYMLTFLIIGTYWIAHHRDFQYIKRYDRRLVWLNLLLLMLVAFLPFPTALLGSYPAQQVTVTFYAGSLAAIGIIRAVLWWYASSHYRLISRSLDPGLVSRITRRSLISPLVFLFSIVVAAYNPLLAMWSWGLVGIGIFATSSDTIGG